MLEFQKMRIATRYVVRPMRLADIAQVIEVERASFPSMWPPTAFKRELQQNRLAHYVVASELHPERASTPPPGQQKQLRGIDRFVEEVRHMLSGQTDEETERELRSLPPVDERAEVILGFIGVWLLPDEAHIVTIAVRDSHRRQGIGELLLISAIKLAQRNGQGLVTLECRVSNEAALGLYEKYGFQQVGLRPRYYSDNHEDAYVLTVSSVITEKYRALFSGLRQEHEQRCGRFDVDTG